MSKWFVILLLGLAVAPAALHAQDTVEVAVTDSVVEVRLSDGSTLFGKIVAVDANGVTIETTAGARVVVARAQIRSVRRVRGRAQEGGEIWWEDANDHRLFVTPTGRAMRSGTSQFGVMELFFPFVSFGVGDRFTMTAGTPIIPEVIGEVFYFAPKVELIRTPQARISASVLAFVGGGSDFLASAGVLYGVGTFGNSDRAVTVGAGFPFYSGEGDNQLADRPLVIFGGEIRTSRRVKLLTENYLISSVESEYNPVTNEVKEKTVWHAMLGAGLRLIGDRISADVGIALFVGGFSDGTECCLPLVNFAYTFGKR